MSNSIKINIDNEEFEIDTEKIQKMAFIYKALDNGWIIRKINKNKYEFSKPGFQKIELNNFLKDHMKIKDILRD